MNIQADASGTRYRSIPHCLRETVASEGPAALVRGAWPLTLRTVPFEACVFLGYEAVVYGFR